MNYSSNLKEEIAKRYTLRYTLNKWRETASEYIWFVSALILAFGATMIFGGNLLEYCSTH